MSQTMVDVSVGPPLFGAKSKRYLKLSKQWLYPYRPRFRDGRFWAVQGLVLLIAGTHALVEAKVLPYDLWVPYFIPTTLFLVPVIYAALTFGFAGALATAIWATVLTIPNWLFWHQGLERWGCISQLLIVNVVAYFVGSQVSRERGARRQTEAVTTALKVSQIKYQNLFESSPMAILVVDSSGTILAANPAASTLFHRDRATLENRHLTDLVGLASAQKLLSTSQDGKPPDDVVLELKDGAKLYLEPTLAEASKTEGNFVIQVLFRDVTEEHWRRAGLKAYAAHVMRTQEEERKLLARELHDDTIQALVLLCRQLDSIEMSGKSLPLLLISALREARRTTEEVVKGLRGFVKALRPPMLDDLGMTASIRRLLADFTERAKIEGTLKIVGEDRRLPSDAELTMFRIAQEALWNAEYHARATRVDVTITFAEREVRLDVVDDGVGFSVPLEMSSFAAGGHLGLLTMQERAELLGGKLELQSSPGKGTKVVTSVPITYITSEIPGHHLDL